MHTDEHVGQREGNEHINIIYASDTGAPSILAPSIFTASENDSNPVQGSKEPFITTRIKDTLQAQATREECQVRFR